jgi:hypothetical protein
MDRIRNRATRPRGSTSATLDRRVHLRSESSIRAWTSAIWITADARSEARTTPSTTSPTATGRSHSSRRMRSGQAPFFRIDVSGGTNPRDRRSIACSPRAMAPLAARWAAGSRVV